MVLAEFSLPVALQNVQSKLVNGTGYTADALSANPELKSLGQSTVHAVKHLVAALKATDYQTRFQSFALMTVALNSAEVCINPMASKGVIAVLEELFVVLRRLIIVKDQCGLNSAQYRHTAKHGSTDVALAILSRLCGIFGIDIIE